VQIKADDIDKKDSKEEEAKEDAGDEASKNLLKGPEDKKKEVDEWDQKPKEEPKPESKDKDKTVALDLDMILKRVPEESKSHFTHFSASEAPDYQQDPETGFDLLQTFLYYGEASTPTVKHIMSLPANLYDAKHVNKKKQNALLVACRNTNDKRQSRSVFKILLKNKAAGADINL
jgi:hypothetical protein